MLSSATPRPRRGQPLSSAEVDHFYPHTTRIICRGALTIYETAALNAEADRIDCDHRGGYFNSIHVVHFQHEDQAEALSRFALDNRLHRLVPNSTQGASREEVEAEWQRIAQEREAIVAWGRSTGMLRDVVQEYRFERRRGAFSSSAHMAAAKVVEKADLSIVDPMNYAGVLIEWAEREHREWFWRCCRDHHVL